MSNNKQTIKSANEKLLAELVGFTGKYTDSLIKSANAYVKYYNYGKTFGKDFQGQSVNDFLKIFALEHKLSVKKFAELKDKAQRILGFFRTGHSMGCYRRLELGKQLFATNNDLDRYANSCKWRPNYGSIHIKLTKKELEQIQNIEGVWTIVNEDGSAKWLEASGSKNSYKVSWVSGFVYGNSHSTKSLREAKLLEARKLEATIQAMQNDSRFIGVADVKKTGACDAGIKAFCDRHGLNMEMGYNLGWLKSLKDGYGKTYLAKVA